MLWIFKLEKKKHYEKKITAHMHCVLSILKLFDSLMILH